MSTRSKHAYVSVSIPIDMIEQIDKIVKSGKGGYRSRAEFIKDAVRRRLEQTKLAQ